MTKEQLEDILSKISFAPNEVGMQWGFEVRYADSSTMGGFLLRTTFRRPDRDTGGVKTGLGRWWYIESDASKSGVVKTCFAACKMILEHELMEAFLFEERRIFDPHNSVDALASLQGPMWSAATANRMGRS